MWDGEIGLVYYNWRYYNARNGSWISRDFFNGEIIANLYLYSNNNPIKYLDEKGLKFIENNNEYKEINVQDSYYDYTDDIKADAITYIVPEDPLILVYKIKTTHINSLKRKVSLDYYKFIPEIKIYQNGKNRNKATGSLLYPTVIQHELRHVEISLDNWNNLVRSVSVYEGVYCNESAPLVSTIIRNLIYIYYHSCIWENVEFDISDYYARGANKVNPSMSVLNEFLKRKNEASNDVRDYEKQLREVMEMFLNSEANN